MNLGNNLYYRLGIQKTSWQVHVWGLVLLLLQGCFSAQDFANAVSKVQDPQQQDASATQDPEKPAPVGSDNICSEARAMSTTAIRLKFDWPADSSLIAILRDGKEVFRTQNSSLKQFSDTGLLEGVNYTYSCLYYKETGFYLGAEKALEETTIVAHPPTFEGISDLITDASDDAIQMQWGAATGVPVQYYQIFYKVGSTVDWTSPQEVIKDPLAWNFDLPTSMLQKNTAIAFGVRACSLNKRTNQSFCDKNTVIKSGTVTFNGAYISDAKIVSIGTVASNFYKLDDTIKIQLTFSQNVNISGSPKLKIKIGTKSVDLSPNNSGSNYIEYWYKVVAGDNTVDADDLTPEGIEAVAPLILTGGSITYNSGSGFKNANVGFTHSDIAKVDTLQPTITGLTPPTAGYYKAGDTLNFRVSFSEPVQVANAPKIKIKIGNIDREAVYVATLGMLPNQVAFRYQVASGESSNGIEITDNRLSGGLITDYVPLTMDASQSFNLPAAAALKSIQIDSTNPTITGITSTDGTYRSGDEISFKVQLNEKGVTVNSSLGSAPILKVQVGTGTKDALYQSLNSDGDQLTFAYRVGGTDNDLDGIKVVELTNSSSIKDPAGNTLTLPSSFNFEFLNIKIDNAVPKIISVSFESTSTYHPLYDGLCKPSIISQIIPIILKTDFPIEKEAGVTDVKISVSLYSPSTPKFATLSSIENCDPVSDGCIGSVMRFEYQIQQNDFDPNGIKLSDKILVSGGNLVRQAYGTPMSLLLPVPAIGTAPKIDAVGPEATFSVSVESPYLDPVNNGLVVSRNDRAYDSSVGIKYFYKLYSTDTNPSSIQWTHFQNPTLSYPANDGYLVGLSSDPTTPSYTNLSYNFDLVAQDGLGNCSITKSTQFILDRKSPSVALDKLKSSGTEYQVTQSGPLNTITAPQLTLPISVTGKCESSDSSSDAKVEFSFKNSSGSILTTETNAVVDCVNNTFTFTFTMSNLTQYDTQATLIITQKDFAKHEVSTQPLTFTPRRPIVILQSVGQYEVCVKGAVPESCEDDPINNKMALPKGTTSINISMWGAGGQSAEKANGGDGAYGAIKNFPVSPGSKLTFIVGEGGSHDQRLPNLLGRGGFAFSGTSTAGSGGGATILKNDADKVLAVIGAGGGGAFQTSGTYTTGANGGNAGTTGYDGSTTGTSQSAKGGTQTGGGQGLTTGCTYSGNNQTSFDGQFWNGQSGGVNNDGEAGGGGGYFGGGGGCSAGSGKASGGGGGSSWISSDPEGTSLNSISTWMNLPSAVTPSSDCSQNGKGGSQTLTLPDCAKNGGDGLVYISW